MLIIHVSNDFPDEVNPRKTHAVKNLLQITSGRIDHFVYSLNRQSPAMAQLAGAIARNPLSPNLSIEAATTTGPVVPLRYGAPGLGIYLRSQLERVADWIASDIERRNLNPQIIHGHKLTMEGIVASRVADRLGIKFGVSIRGNTDTKILRARPDLKGVYRRIFHDAAVAFFFAPWVKRHVERTLGHQNSATHTIPVPTNADRIIPPKIVGPRLMTAFHLDGYENKNARRLIEAARVVGRDVPDFELSIVGGGSQGPAREVEALCAKSRVRLEGAIAHDAMQDRMNSAGGFALVSKRESFGMVFIEALLAGCPVVYPKGRAIDGHFDDCSFAIAADPDDQDSITEAMRKLATDEERLKSALAQWQEGDGPRFFQRDAIAEAYTDAMIAAVGAAT